ncbi:aminotransferase-like domain-containing protein [Rhizobium terrae]|uniref:aminotransferase-like domain-containing protein n=1 Tax=Rhizobium terrae TaxID=2171756 RepID=UPI000E3EC15B|nr:PLP-dependent aminotransferase family protein [Rhizobium terrae]
MAEIRSRIAGRGLVPGARLPSVRAFARTMHVSASTVVEAYERLAAEGLIRSRPGSGFYVSSPLAPLSLSEIGPKLDRAIDPFWVSRQSLEEGDLLKPGCGWLPSAWMPEAAIRRALRNLSRAEDRVLSDYGAPLGSLPLRQLLSRRMGEHGIAASPDQIVLTESGTQAIDLLCRFLIEPGDVVLVDDPCYFNFHALLRAHRAKVIGVPMTPAGPDIEAFGQALEEHEPRLYITNSGIHNPTGATLSPVVAHRLLKLAERADLTIVEDDIFADLEHEPSPRLAAFDGLDRVVHIGSFSKTLSASVRCGFIAAKPEWIEALVDLKIATNFAASRLSSELVLTLLTDGSYRRHLDELRLRLAKAMQATEERLAAIGIKPWLRPRAGMFLWCRLPDEIEAADLAHACLHDGVILAPGNVFSQSQNAGGFLRFNVAQSQDPRMFESLARALRRQS